MSQNKSNLRLAFVLPRYGKALGGGAETLLGSLARELAAKPYLDQFEVEKVEVWTTCALDHRTWENELKQGVGEEDNIVVRRFLVSPRNLDAFIESELLIAEGRPLSSEQQLSWLEQSVNSHDLYEHIAKHAKDFDFILFAPYLFGTSFWGPLIAPERSILVPCLHNEPYAYQPVFRLTV